MIKPVKPIPIGPVLLIGCGVILIITVVIWQILMMQPNILSPRPSSGPVPTLEVPRSSSSNNLSRAYYQGKILVLDGSDYSSKYLDFSFTHL
jgi:hypothetical protein